MELQLPMRTAKRKCDSGDDHEERDAKRRKVIVKAGISLLERMEALSNELDNLKKKSPAVQIPAVNIPKGTNIVWERKNMLRANGRMLDDELMAMRTKLEKMVDKNGGAADRLHLSIPGMTMEEKRVSKES